MSDILLIALGVLVGSGLVAAIYYLSQVPRRFGRMRWLASASGERDDPTKDWPGDPNSMP